MLILTPLIDSIVFIHVKDSLCQKLLKCNPILLVKHACGSISTKLYYSATYCQDSYCAGAKERGDDGELRTTVF